MDVHVIEVDVFEFARATDALASAFADDPVLVSVFSPANKAEVRAKLAKLCPDMFRLYETSGRVFIGEQDGVVAGAAIMHTPNYPQAPDAVRSTFQETFLRHNKPEQLPMWSEAMGAFGDIRDRAQYHLSVLGVHPYFQRQGIGTAILDHILEFVDAERQGIHLNTFKLENLDYYQRFGFKVTEERLFLGTPGWHLKRGRRE